MGFLPLPLVQVSLAAVDESMSVIWNQCLVQSTVSNRPAAKLILQLTSLAPGIANVLITFSRVPQSAAGGVVALDSAQRFHTGSMETSDQ